ncbi:hypothetical protein J7K99_06795 [bacterium]|nr:hypothetical protein [bacterium]
MHGKLSVVLLIFVLVGACFSQGWERTYGEDGDDLGWSVIQTSDGGYFIAATTWPSTTSYSDLYLIKTNSLGDTLWTRVYGGFQCEEACQAKQTSDGGYAVVGWTGSFGAGYYDFYLIRTDPNGDTLWTRTYGGTGNDFAYGLAITPDGGFLLAGTYASDYYRISEGYVYLVRTDSVGDTLWTRTYGGTLSDVAYALALTADGGSIVAGATYSFGAGEDDVYVLKFDPAGDTLWARVYGGPENDAGYAVAQTSDGGYIIAGTTSSFGAGGYDVYLLRLNPDGDTLWTRTYGGANDDGAHSVAQTPDGGYILVGSTFSFGAGSNDVYIIKTDSVGNLLWQRTVGGHGNDAGSSLDLTTDGGFIITGYTTSSGAGGYDVYLVKADSFGYVDTTNFPPAFTICPSDTQVIIHGVAHMTFRAQDPDDDPITYSLIEGPEPPLFEHGQMLFRADSVGVFHFVITACDTHGACDTCEFYVTVVDTPDTDAIPEVGAKPKALSLQIQPNPFNSSCAIVALAGAVVEVYDLQGNRIATLSAPHSQSTRFKDCAGSFAEYIWSPDESVPSGIYIVRATKDNRTAIRRAILIR